VTSAYRRLLVRLLALLRPLTRWVLGGEIQPASLLTVASEEGTEARYYALLDLNLEITAAFVVLFTGACIVSLLAIPVPRSASDWVLGLVAVPMLVLIAESVLRQLLTSRAVKRIGRTGVPSPRIPRVLIPSAADLLLPAAIIALAIASFA
jgi:hypothetical protein